MLLFYRSEYSKIREELETPTYFRQKGDPQLYLQRTGAGMVYPD